MARARKRYTVVLEPDEGGWWAVSVKEVPGCRTQARSIRQGRRRIRDALALFVTNAATAELVEDIRLPDEVIQALHDAAEARERAEREQQAASALARDAARRLTGSMSVRDAGEVMGISHQRVQQLVKADRDAA